MGQIRLKPTPPALLTALSLRASTIFSQFPETIRQAFLKIGRPHLKTILKKKLPLILLLVFVLAVFGVIAKYGRGLPTVKDPRVAIKGARATLPLNREFSFPLKDAKGKELTRIKYTIETAELRDEIIVKGKRAVSVKGRTFLILTFKIVNDYDKPIEMNVRDYVRLSLNGNETELLAADIHNDPVAVQALSTKYTRLGFPINDTDTKLVLFVGELAGEKTKIDLAFAAAK